MSLEYNVNENPSKTKRPDGELGYAFVRYDLNRPLKTLFTPQSHHRLLHLRHRRTGSSRRFSYFLFSSSPSFKKSLFLSAKDVIIVTAAFDACIVKEYLRATLGYPNSVIHTLSISDVGHASSDCATTLAVGCAS